MDQPLPTCFLCRQSVLAYHAKNDACWDPESYGHLFCGEPTIQGRCGSCHEEPPEGRTNRDDIMRENWCQYYGPRFDPYSLNVVREGRTMTTIVIERVRGEVKA